MPISCRSGCLILILLALTACGNRNTPAPVVELQWNPPGTAVGYHKVSRGETLYAVAFRYDQDFRKLAALNHLHSPYTLRVGQTLQLQNGLAPVTRQRQPARPIPVNISEKRPIWIKPGRKNSQSTWKWPATGRVTSHFLPAQGKKGIDIAGKKGDKIHAAASGVVAYSGAGLAGYGNLIIIKHNDAFLTAYANNSKNLVREGQAIKAGQIIAEMGVIDRRYWGVHFEIRKSGNPVNPLQYLR